MTAFGPIILLGSGETAPSAHKIHHWGMDHFSPPISVAIIETPAGFEPNSDLVASKVGEYLVQHLQNFQPQIEIIPARKRGTMFSPNDPDLLAPALESDYLFMGPGSPTYAVRQLAGSYAWHALIARQRLGGALCLSSACSIAASQQALPIYEIYKVGEDLHWKPGLDLFAPYGLDLVVVPHWNNRDGGDELDTSHCYVGTERYNRLVEMLDPSITILGIDENTAVTISPESGECQVLGVGGAVVIRDGQTQYFKRRERFPASLLGPWRLPQPDEGIPPEIWQAAQAAQAERVAATQAAEAVDPAVMAQAEALAAQREAARLNRDWATADQLRDQIIDLGLRVQDTPDGPVLEPME